MLTAIFIVLRAIIVACGGHRVVALENVALRQQLAALKRSVKRPELRARDRLFWVMLAMRWREWRTALVFVQPDTVLRWHVMHNVPEALSMACGRRQFSD